MTHWKILTNPDYLGSYALENGEDVVLTIASVAKEVVVGAEGVKKECVVARFEEDNTKPMILNVTNMKTIQRLLQTPYIEKWPGHKIQIGVEKVKFRGEVVDGLRVRDRLPSQHKETPKCGQCGKEIQGMGNRGADYMAKYTAQKYGKPLCSACAIKAAKEGQH